MPNGTRWKTSKTNNLPVYSAPTRLNITTSFAELLGQLATKIKPGGVMILSGPTENALYRLGRKIAGFDGHYHTTTIHHIELAAAQHMSLLERRRAPFGVPLFSISAWRKT